MVRAEARIMNLGLKEIRKEVCGNKKVIYTPPDVFSAGLTKMRPPGVANGIGMESTKSINKISGEEISDALALLIGESGVMMIGLGAGKIDFLVCSIKITTSDNWFLLGKISKISSEERVPNLMAQI